MENSKLIFGVEYHLKEIKKYDRLFVYHFSDSSNNITKIMMENPDEKLSWESLETEITKEKRMKLLDFIYYHGPINGGLSVTEIDILARGVMSTINGIKAPETRRREEYATDDDHIAQLMANAYNEGVRDTVKMNK